MSGLFELLSHVGIHWLLRKMHGFRPLTDLEHNDVALQHHISEDPLYWFGPNAYLSLRTAGDTAWRVRLRKYRPLLHLKIVGNRSWLMGALWRSTLGAYASAQRRREE